MNVNGRLILMLLMAIVVLIGGNVIVFLYPRWEASQPARERLEAENQGSCLKVSDFYSVHLTSFFYGTSDDAVSSKDKDQSHGQYCDRIPGTGLVVFTVDLMEQEARDQAVALSLSRYDSQGQLKLLRELPAKIHPDGVLTMNAAVPEKGRYILKVAFGAAKTKDDIIEMPIMVAP
ncbi:hypothetical protein [Methylocapsa palsarum]|uniref:Uncharacterized protein n=1 Tax=Methylocapsa palsarum TaxID=1612308 RepID=A0A1I4BK99_9HYPH|nr:hypothetical protein [Methylocapsa palsarum]SFK69198.1 hypothetical protein SAMN05444581_11565 [Methylocapsa palsarum]